MPQLRGVVDSEAIVLTLRESVIGRGLVISTPFGRRVVTYADYTASGRLLELVENYLRQHVYPWCAMLLFSGSNKNIF